MQLLPVGFVLAALAVIFGAFGAHALSETLTPERLVTWETAVRYQMYSGLGIALSSLHPRLQGKGSRMLLLGAAIFSGSLYLLCLTDVRILGAITPIGGVCMIAGWLQLAWASTRIKEDE